MKNSTKFKVLISQFISFFIYPTFLNANVLFPAISLMPLAGMAKVTAPLVMLLGLIIEWIVIKKITKLSLKDSFIITFVMNAISAIFGAIIIAVIGLAILFFSVKVLNIGDLLKNFRSYELSFIIGLIISVIINVIIESKIFFWKYPKNFNKKKILNGIIFANILSAIILAIWTFSRR